MSEPVYFSVNKPQGPLRYISLVYKILVRLCTRSCSFVHGCSSGANGTHAFSYIMGMLGCCFFKRVLTLQHAKCRRKNL